MNEDLIKYMDYQWISVDDGVLTIGINEEGVDQLDDIRNIDLPPESSEVMPEEIFGEIDTEGGPLNLYSPVDGKVIEINEAVLQNPKILTDDCYGDGWLVRVEAENPEQLDEIEDRPLDNSDDYDEE